MSRVTLVVGSFSGRSDVLRKIMARSGCREIRFTTPEHWRYSLNGAEPGAIVLTDSIEKIIRERIAAEVVANWSPDCLHDIGSESAAAGGSAVDHCRVTVAECACESNR